VHDAVLARAREHGVVVQAGRIHQARGTSYKKTAASHEEARLLKESMMAKALYGHVSAAPDRRLLDEVTRLRSHAQALEFEITRLRAENDRLSAAAADANEMLRLSEPALT
jgi:hypothetical protein